VWIATFGRPNTGSHRPPVPYLRVVRASARRSTTRRTSPMTAAMHDRRMFTGLILAQPRMRTD
jgi:hypothetical protein